MMVEERRWAWAFRSVQVLRDQLAKEQARSAALAAALRPYADQAAVGLDHPRFTRQDEEQLYAALEALDAYDKARQE
jgi:hypothetical protein